MPTAPDRETVVLVHGLWLGPWAMAPLAARLRAAGFDVRRWGYRSVRGTLAGAARELADHLHALGIAPAHLVGHSLGGLVILSALIARPDLPEGRVLLLGSPVLGSHAGRALAKLPGGARLLGGCVAQWRPLEHAPTARDIGVIAGHAGIGLGRLVAPGLPAPNDGTVAVAETRLPGAEHVVLPVSHTSMLVSPAVARAAAQFLATGRFAGEAAVTRSAA